jgi:hypothetical protein
MMAVKFMRAIIDKALNTTAILLSTIELETIEPFSSVKENVIQEPIESFKTIILDTSDGKVARFGSWAISLLSHSNDH